MSSTIEQKALNDLYINKKYSVAKIAEIFGCSQNKINYWLAKYDIKKRSISDAIYTLRNPLGDPFEFRKPSSLNEGILYGLGLGLYWGEGLKRGNGAVRLGNTDLKLILKFIEFLEFTFNVKREKLKFGLQIFDDITPEVALNYWVKNLKVKRSQFYKVIVSRVRSKGTYKYKSQHGVLMVYFNNIKLKKKICEMIENL